MSPASHRAFGRRSIPRMTGWANRARGTAPRIRFDLSQVEELIEREALFLPFFHDQSLLRAARRWRASRPSARPDGPEGLGSGSRAMLGTKLANRYESSGARTRRMGVASAPAIPAHGTVAVSDLVVGSHGDRGALPARAQAVAK